MSQNQNPKQGQNIITYSQCHFLKKISSGMHSDPKFSQRWGGVSNIDVRIKGSGMLSWLASF
jgi:hypothetical protein